MAASFVPCPACARHVRQSDFACPFCGAEVLPEKAGATPTLRGRLSRAAMLAAGAAGVALSGSECGPPPAGTVFYGAAVFVDSGEADTARVDALADATGSDAGSSDATRDE